MNMLTDVTILIPARMKATRLPGKPLLMAGDKPLMQWTYETAKKVTDNVFIIAGDHEILEAAESFGLDCIQIAAKASCGTARCALALRSSNIPKSMNNIINWQVDEPMVNPNDIKIIAASGCSINTLVSNIPIKDYSNVNIVKAAVGFNGKCMWFSRAPMAGCLGHVGIYCFSVDVLISLGRFYAMSESAFLTREEGLEQLEWLQLGYKIWATRIPDFMPLSINTQEDFNKFKEIVEK